MKKYIIAVGLLALPFLASASIDTNLKYGSRGTEVIELQEFLISKKYLTTAATGNFFSLTKAAVIAYQNAEAITPAAGFVGPITRSKINAELALDDSAEIQETGTVTAPIQNSQTDLLKQQNTLLQQQVTQLKQIASSTNTLGNVQAPPVVVTVTPTPTPTVVIDPNLGTYVDVESFSCDKVRSYCIFHITNGSGNDIYLTGFTLNVTSGETTNTVTYTFPLTGSNLNPSVVVSDTDTKKAVQAGVGRGIYFIFNDATATSVTLKSVEYQATSKVTVRGLPVAVTPN